MKILLIQLARLGDIYLTWPTLSAIRRKFPEAQIDILVRDLFSEALEGNPSINSVLKLKTAEILGPIIVSGDEDLALSKLQQFVLNLEKEKYDKIINLSFSVFSSYLVARISGENTQISGYTRYTDGYLSIPDDQSAYFYAQVGVDKSNRVHLTTIFSAVADVDLIPEDWSAKPDLNVISSFGIDFEDYIILQPGASQKEKTFGVSKWAQFVNHFRKLSDLPILFVGSKEERGLVDEIILKTQNLKLYNLAGKTSLRDIMSLCCKAKLAIGNDSVLTHIASLTKTTTLNISMDTVNFWETGPMASKSKVIFGNHPEDIASDRVAYEAFCMLKGEASGNDVYEVKTGEAVAYYSKTDKSNSWNWRLIQAIYMGSEFPEPENPNTLLAMTKLKELAVLALEQIHWINTLGKSKVEVEILKQIDDLIELVPKYSPELTVLVAWFQTERIRIGPSSKEEIFKSTLKCFNSLIAVVDLYLTSYENLELGGEIVNTNVL